MSWAIIWARNAMNEHLVTGNQAINGLTLWARLRFSRRVKFNLWDLWNTTFTQPYIDTSSAMNARNILPAVRRKFQRSGLGPWTSQWICSSCRLNYQPFASFSTSRLLQEKPYYVTTPIFYVNAGGLRAFSLSLLLISCI